MNTSLIARAGQLLSASGLVLVASVVHAAADTPTRAEIEYQINQAAPLWMIDAENHHLSLTRLHLPRQEGDAGGACGAIRPVGSPRFIDQMNSYKATLIMLDGSVQVAAVTTFYMPVEKLLQDPLCD